MIDFIEFVNTTTRLPVDVEIVTERLNKIAKDFLPAVENKRLDKKPICVLFVDVKDIEKYIDDENTDPCGRYFPHHPDAHKALIYICPEKILAWCTCICKDSQTNPNPNPVSISELYPSLLNFVIIHELTHFIMDPWAEKDHACHISWDKLVGNNFNIESQCSPFEKYYDSSKFSKKCALSRRFMEESLAEAVALNQNYDREIKKALRARVNKSSSPYKAGLKWTNNLGKLLQIAKLWADFKETCVNPKSPSHWIHGDFNLPLTNSYKHLIKPDNNKLTLEDAKTNFDLTLFKETEEKKLKDKMEKGSDVEKFWVAANENCNIKLLKMAMSHKEDEFRDIRIAAVKNRNANQFVLLLGMQDTDPEVVEAANKTFKEKFSTRN